jgi:hypothetical protein
MTKNVSPVSSAAPFEPPTDAATLTDLDRAYATLYVRLLDAEAAGVEWTTAAHQILNLDPTDDFDRAKSIFDRFLARARWMTTVGYALLLKSRV